MFAGLDDPKFWELRAEAARMLAEEMNDDTAKATMLQIAGSYDRLAAHSVLKAKTIHSKVFEQASANPNAGVRALQTAR